MTTPTPYIVRRRIRCLQQMLARITRKLAEYEADVPPPMMKVHALRSEKLALEWVLDYLGEPRQREAKQPEEAS